MQGYEERSLVFTSSQAQLDTLIQTVDHVKKQKKRGDKDGLWKSTKEKSFLQGNKLRIKLDLTPRVSDGENAYK